MTSTMDLHESWGGFPSASEVVLLSASPRGSRSSNDDDLGEIGVLGDSRGPPLSRSTMSHKQRLGRLHDSGSSKSLGERLTSYTIPVQDFNGPVHYGWLWKKGSSMKTWKKRFFMLHGCTLTYYTQSCVIESENLGTHCLDVVAKGGLRVASARLTSDTQFGIKVTSSSGRILCIQAGDQNSRMQWLKALEQAPQRKMEHLVRQTHGSGFQSLSACPSPGYSPFDTSISTLSSDDGDEESRTSLGPGDKEGWLFVRSAFLHTWKQRFVTLQNGHITVRGDRRQAKGAEVIGIAPWLGKDHALCVRLARGRELYVAAPTEEEAMAWLDAFKICL